MTKTSTTATQRSLREVIADDSHALTFQTSGQYRAALLKHEPMEHTHHAEAFAWAVFAKDDNVIIWSKNRAQVESASEEYRRPIVPVIALFAAEQGAAPVPQTHCDPAEGFCAKCREQERPALANQPAPTVPALTLYAETDSGMQVVERGVHVNEFYHADEVDALLAKLEHQPAQEQAVPVDGDMLPPVGAKVLIHLGRQDAWIEHTVTGYYVWPACKHQVKDGEKDAHRVFVRVKDAQGYESARLLSEVKLVGQDAQQEPVAAPQQAVAPGVDPLTFFTALEVFKQSDQSITAAQNFIDAIENSAPGTPEAPKKPAHGHRDDYYLLTNGRRLGLEPISRVRNMPNWVLAMELFATGSTSAHQLCRDAGLDPDSTTTQRVAQINGGEGEEK